MQNDTSKSIERPSGIDNKSVSNRSGHSTIVEHVVGFSKEMSTKDNVANFLMYNTTKNKDSLGSKFKSSSEVNLKYNNSFESKQNEAADMYAMPIGDTKMRESPINNSNKINIKLRSKMGNIEEEELSSVYSKDNK